MDDKQTGITTLCPTASGNNGNEGVLNSRHRMEFSDMPRIPLFWVRGLTPLQRIQSAYSKPHRLD